MLDDEFNELAFNQTITQLEFTVKLINIYNHIHKIKINIRTDPRLILH